MSTRFEFAALQLSVSEVARRTGVTRRTVVRWKHGGIPRWSADTVAIRLGSHPAVIWSNWDSV
jgi:transcriptional regulator with XRE-family HTH domain